MKTTILRSELLRIVHGTFDETCLVVEENIDRVSINLLNGHSILVSCYPEITKSGKYIEYDTLILVHMWNENDSKRARTLESLYGFDDADLSADVILGKLITHALTLLMS